MTDRIAITLSYPATAGATLAATEYATVPVHAPSLRPDPLTATILRSGSALLERQYQDGYWRFDLEADTTIPSEYILLQHFMGTADHARHGRLCDYIRGRQLPDGSWPLYEGGQGNVSATVKAYFALKITGEPMHGPVLSRARQWVLAHGGAESSNVFTRIMLALFGQLPWRTVPAMPAEIIWLPRWFFFNLNRVSYWSRCVIVPLLILFARRPVFRVPEGLDIRELFCSDPQRFAHIDRLDGRRRPLRSTFIAIDRVLKWIEPWTPGPVRRRSLRRCEQWMREHMQGEGGIGGIFPAMANAVMALKILGNKPAEDADMARGMQAIEDLVLDGGDESYVQPCLSPIWDTCLSINALAECGVPEQHPALESAVTWLFNKQVFVRGDWTVNAPDVDGGGWAFQFENEKYPDVDDTGMVVMSLLRAGAHHHPDRRRRMSQAVNWMLGMQNPDGGWGAFDIDNHHEYLNNIPFADHGALVDPSTADLTGRCIEMLAMMGYDRKFPPIARALEFLRRDQRPSGAWYGRWGVNYVYGTWAVLVGLGALGEDPNQPHIRKAVQWLKDVQNSDGGWGEDCNTYDDPSLCGRGRSTASQTAWALLGLMAVGEVGSEPVQRGIRYLMRNFDGKVGWEEAPYTGTGFPRVFYLRYHGYSHYFPLWALGVYRNLTQGYPTRQDALRNEPRSEWGPFPALRQRSLH
ncbi:MAG: squalene--hopene cyclase [Gammaproteobacteria bacterium]|nr:squalene--hopene cyclase [Gammaproteobacteria bacterium]